MLCHAQKQAVVTAWEVTGKVDYEKLCKEFGCTPIPRSLVERIEKLTGVPAHPFLKRGVFYAHRDVEELLDLWEKGEKFYLYTGATANMLENRFIMLLTPGLRPRFVPRYTERCLDARPQYLTNNPYLDTVALLSSLQVQVLSRGSSPPMPHAHRHEPQHCCDPALQAAAPPPRRCTWATSSPSCSRSGYRTLLSARSSSSSRTTRSASSRASTSTRRGAWRSRTARTSSRAALT